MTSVVRVYDPPAIGEVISQMAYGAVVNYTHMGIEYQEILSIEDYEVLFDLDDVMKELDEKNDD